MNCLNIQLMSFALVMVLVLLLAVAVVDAIDEVEHDLLDFSSIGEVVDLLPGKLLLR